MDLSSDKAQQATRIVRELRAAGFSAYLVGGCVRDLVLSRNPTDYDVATSATPQEVMQLGVRGNGLELRLRLRGELLLDRDERLGHRHRHGLRVRAGRQQLRQSVGQPVPDGRSTAQLRRQRG